MQRSLKRQNLGVCAGRGVKLGEVQQKPVQTWHHPCNPRQLSQDLYT